MNVVDTLASNIIDRKGVGMTSVRAYAHHGPIPERFLTATVPALPVPGVPEPVRVYWCELVAQWRVADPGGGAPGYGQAGAVAPDQWRFDVGYADDADDFVVSGLCVLLVGATQDDYEYVLVSPSGVRCPVP